jgi:hypothetical protein
MLEVTAEFQGTPKQFTHVFTEPHYLRPALEILQNMAPNEADVTIAEESDGAYMLRAPKRLVGPKEAEIYAVSYIDLEWRMRKELHYEGNIFIQYITNVDPEPLQYRTVILQQPYVDPKSGDPLPWMELSAFLRAHPGEVIRVADRDLETHGTLSLIIGKSTLTIHAKLA